MKKNFIFTSELAKQLTLFPQAERYGAMVYAIRYGLGVQEESDREEFEVITRLVDKANRPAVKVAQEDVVSIIEHLNEKCGRSYRASSERTKRFIAARMNEGHTVEDFFAVIDGMVEEWEGGHLSMYLRPETLFGPKFEGYLNNAKRKEKPSGSFDTDSFFGAALARSYAGLEG